MKLIIAGDRRLRSWDLVNVWASNVAEFRRITEVVSGHAPGADRLGEEWAANAQLPCKQFPAQWDKHGKSAGFIRNIEMAKYADMLLAFPAPDSKGTPHMIEAMVREQKPVLIVPVEVEDDSR